MSEESLEIVRGMYEAFYRFDVDGTLAYYDPEVVIDSSRVVDGELGHGHEGVYRFIAGWVGSFDEWHEEIEEMRDLGTQVYVVARQVGRGKVSGVEVEQRYAVLHEIQGDKISRVTIYREPAEALKAAGLSQ
jgi:ketosteroid isomerase-like protein